MNANEFAERFAYKVEKAQEKKISAFEEAYAFKLEEKLEESMKARNETEENANKQLTAQEFIDTYAYKPMKQNWSLEIDWNYYALCVTGKLPK